MTLSTDKQLADRIIDAIRQWDAEYLGGYIPSPEEQTVMDFNNAM